MSGKRLIAGFALLFGALGLAGCPAKASVDQSITLCDFESLPDKAAENPNFDIPSALKKPTYPKHDFRWGTSGYATLEPIDKDSAKAIKDKVFYKYFHGKSAAKIRFTVPGDYKKFDADSRPKVWETGLSLGTETHTPLKHTDWSQFRYLTFNLFNPSGRAQNLKIRFSDSAANVTQTAIDVPASGPADVEIDLGFLALARLNTQDIRQLTLYLDTATQDSDPVLILDDVALHTADIEVRRKAELEDGEEADDEEEDWDSEDEEDAAKAPKNPIVRPGQAALVAPAAVSATAAPAAASATAK